MGLTKTRTRTPKLTNLLPERLEKYNLDNQTLHEMNPGLVYAVVSPWGLEGAEINNPGFDMTAFFARGGIMSLLGPPGGPPVIPRSGMGDHTTGLMETQAEAQLRDSLDPFRTAPDRRVP